MRRPPRRRAAKLPRVLAAWPAPFFVFGIYVGSYQRVEGCALPPPCGEQCAVPRKIVGPMSRPPAPPLGKERAFQDADETPAPRHREIVDLGGPHRHEAHECEPPFVCGKGGRHRARRSAARGTAGPAIGSVHGRATLVVRGRVSGRTAQRGLVDGRGDWLMDAMRRPSAASPPVGPRRLILAVHRSSSFETSFTASRLIFRKDTVTLARSRAGA